MMIDQESALGGSVPSCGSTPVPAKLIVSPTFHVNVDAGVVMVAAGAPLLGEIRIGLLMLLAPWLSVTLRRTVTGVEVVYVNEGFANVESSYWPSPLRSHAYVIESPGCAGIEPVLEKLTVNGVGPPVGLPEATAIGPYSIRQTLPPSKSG